MAKQTNQKAANQKTDSEPEKRERTTVYLTPTQISKTKFIAFMDDGVDSQTSFISEAIDEAISKWEKKNGEAVKR